jgi:hypothetical protein
VPVADPPLTPGRRFATRSASAIVMRAPSSATSARCRASGFRTSTVVSVATAGYMQQASVTSLAA